MRVARAISNLIEAFERLPGVGPKSAARLTYYLLHVPQAELERLSEAIVSLKRDTRECGVCHNVGETDPCDICADGRRDRGVVCVVEQPLDVLAMEKANGFGGVYHVLHGVIDPLHNIGPEEIKISELLQRLEEGDGVREVILALNPNMEGEATCMYLKNQVQKISGGVRITRLAQGLAVGADIEYADDRTLSQALEGRREY